MRLGYQIGVLVLASSLIAGCAGQAPPVGLRPDGTPYANNAEWQAAHPNVDQNLEQLEFPEGSSADALGPWYKDWYRPYRGLFSYRDRLHYRW